MSTELGVLACIVTVTALAAMGAFLALVRVAAKRYPVVAVHEDHMVTQLAPLFPDRTIPYVNVTRIEAISATVLRIELGAAEMPRSLRLHFAPGQPDRAASIMASMSQRFEAFSMRAQLERERARGRNVGYGRLALLRRRDV